MSLRYDDDPYQWHLYLTWILREAGYSVVHDGYECCWGTLGEEAGAVAGCALVETDAYYNVRFESGFTMASLPKNPTVEDVVEVLAQARAEGRTDYTGRRMPGTTVPETWR